MLRGGGFFFNHVGDYTYISGPSLDDFKMLTPDLGAWPAVFARNLFRNVAGVMRFVFLISGSNCSSNMNALVLNKK